MQRLPVITKDGSHTISVPQLNATYHSLHGAIQESMHVFLNAGLHVIVKDNLDPGPISIFEMGFGTGLNALLTLLEAEKMTRPISYNAVELFPLTDEECKQLNYCDQLNNPDCEALFTQIQNAKWETETIINQWFTLKKSKADLLTYQPSKLFQLIYYDAFAPSAQPELWTQSIFEKLYAMTASEGILVTYCSKSIVRRAMQAAGFFVERIPGPWGKRQMLRATKLVNPKSASPFGAGS